MFCRISFPIQSWIPTKDMPADISTKSLPFVIFSPHRDAHGLIIPENLYKTSE